MRVTGVVQGVGFRPFVYAAATELAVTGFVGNDAAGVTIEAQGPPAAIDELIARVRRGPTMARVEDLDVQSIGLQGDESFRIVASVDTAGVTSIPPDTAVCDECLTEMRDPADRRHGYAFIACTNCGPRYTIVTGLPYDRPFTTMVDFPMCSDCQQEYDDPASRRFHAQPTACPRCGPQLSTDVASIVADLQAGRIVALKGVGGYHLACDGRNAAAVERLRRRKQRGDKPFALMAADVSVALTIGALEAAIDTLTSPARPIVLATSRDERLQESVAPGNSYLGVLLPYAPLHHLLFDAGAPRVLVMTSGNLADEPICTTPDEAQERLPGIADSFLHHNRRIHVACDDSVVRVSGTGLQPVRRSRGYAPLPLTLPIDCEPVIAVGGELKTTICVADGRWAWLSQHIGDTENLETLAMLARTVETLTTLQRVRPVAIISDLHPGYLSRRWAQEEAQRRHVPHLMVQHHHAHVASLLAEHIWPDDRPVLGFAFDGTGYGLDGTVWGGELLLGTYAAVERVGHLAPIPLPGGDAATRRPLRSALAHAHAARLPLSASLPALLQAEPNEVAVINRMLATGAGCTSTTSVGRLFDAVASLLDVRQSIDYEGQAAIELEALAAGAGRVPIAGPDWALGVHVTDGEVILDPAPAIAAALAAALSGLDRGMAARAFHEGLAASVCRAAILVRARTGVDTVGLTGGVFANVVLTGECQGRLEQEGFTVLLHRMVPANDGGLALGQVAVAAAGGATQGQARGA
jgi:hydrogenase maturation protein HypF